MRPYEDGTRVVVVGAHGCVPSPPVSSLIAGHAIMVTALFARSGTNAATVCCRSRC